MKSLIFAIILSLFLFLVPAQAKAQELVFSDDFSGGLDKWQPTRDDGQYWQTKDGKAEVVVPIGSTVTELVPKDAFWNQAWQELEYSYELTPLQGFDKNTSFGYQDLLNWYELHFISNAVNLVHLVDGRAILNTFFPFVMENGQTYKIKIQFLPGNIKVFIDGQLVIDQDDWSFDNSFGKVGLKAGTGAAFPTRLLYDNVEVKLIPTTNENEHKLAVPAFKQSDPAWANEEYDTASSWTEKNQASNMSRWGCLTTSAAMVLNYHGLTTLINGNPLTPQTLNNWLKEQPDGYVGNGLMNWMAITRLARRLNEQNGTTKLEYSYLANDLTDRIQTEIDENRPPILEISNHFMVGTGYEIETEQLNDVFINDPFYDFQNFNQHQTELVSVRQLKPSQTDLSYILIVASPNLTVELLDDSGQQVKNLQKFTQQITAIDDNATSPPQQILQVPKPVSGNYTINFNQSEFNKYDIEIYAYDDQANSSILKKSGFVDKEILSIELNYNKNGQSEFTYQTNLENILTTIEKLRVNGFITKHWLAFRMIAKPETIFELAKTYSPFLKTGVEEYLLTEISELTDNN